MAEAFEEKDLDEVAKSLVVETPDLDSITFDDGEEPKRRPEGDDDVTPDEGDVEEGEEPAQEDEDGSEENIEDIDVDDIEIDVTVDGETKAVKLKDLKARYSGEAAIESRLQEATETKSKVYEVGNTLYHALNVEAEKLNALDLILQKHIEPNVNWEKLRTEDPGRYLLEREKARDAVDTRNRITQERQRIATEQARLNGLAWQDYARREATTLLHKIPDFAVPEKAKTVMRQLNEAASSYGFSPEELGQVVDHRLILVLADAAKYHQAQSKQKAAAIGEKIVPKTLLKPSAKRGTPQSTRKKELAVTYARAKASGKPEDIAKLLLIKRK